MPEVCSCGQDGLVDLRRYHPPRSLRCPACVPTGRTGCGTTGRAGGTRCTATVPADPSRDYGPRLPGVVGERAGLVGASRRAVQDLCAAVFGIPLSQGAMPKMVDCVSEAIL